MSSILIVIGGHLSSAPRAEKEASCLSAAGYDVTVTGIWHDPKLAEYDLSLAENGKYRFYCSLDLRSRTSLIGLLARLKHSIARKLDRTLPIQNNGTLGYGVKELKNFALKSKADLTIGHSATSFPALLALSEIKQKIAVDFEDWFSENETAVATKSKVQLIRHFEKTLIQRASFTFCPSEVMANSIGRRYNAKVPIVIFNSFEPEHEANPKSQIDDDPLKLIWYSQTIGHGRGLNLLFEALENIDVPLKLTLLGRSSSMMRDHITHARTKVSQHEIQVLPAVAPWELNAIISSHDIGLSLENNWPVNKKLTISNKFFQYMACGIGQIATATDGQSEVWPDQDPPGILIPCRDSKALASAIAQIQSNKGMVIDFRRSAKIISESYAPAKLLFPRIIAATENVLNL